ncbi:MAG: hypothetical protein HQ548_06290 [Chloroflexi bacterium]|nr:hypothetical protein [Chloroflexota bacterium]
MKSVGARLAHIHCCENDRGTPGTGNVDWDGVFDALPYDCVPVGIEIAEDAIDLVQFSHPERACYIFGPENGSVSADTVARCEHIVKIPTALSLNLAATVNVVLYDRLAKSPRRAPAVGAGGEDVEAS